MRYILLLLTVVGFIVIYNKGNEEVRVHDEMLTVEHYHPDMGMVRGIERCRAIPNGYLCQHKVQVQISQSPL